jgi:hypothetical protein
MQKRAFLGALVVALCVLGYEYDPSATLPVRHPVMKGSVEDDTTPGGFCKLHHVPYAVEVIPVFYGYPASPKLTESQWNWLEEDRAARQKSFPYTHVASKAGGCEVREARFAKVNYCPECKKADEEWHAKHGQLPPAEKAN